MVLPGRLGGRVGRCRNIFGRAALESRAARPFPTVGYPPMPKALPHRTSREGRAAGPKTAGLGRALEEELRSASRAADQGETIARFERAAALLERGDSKGAVREAERAKALASRSASVREILGIALYRQERWREALAELKAYKRITDRVDHNHLIAD